MNYFIDAYKRYADFSGRSTTREFWMFFLMFYVILFCASIAVFIAALMQSLVLILSIAIPFTLFVFATYIPALAIMIRRLRDAGKEWYWIFITFVPLAGAIWLIVLLCQPSIEQQEN